MTTDKPSDDLAPSGSTPGASPTSVQVASLAWAFSQNHPLNTEEFIAEARRRGFVLDLSTLRELYRHALLVPFVYLSDRRVAAPSPVEDYEPRSGSTNLTQLRIAPNKGRLTDLATTPFRPRLRFERRFDPDSHWWNGLLYSRYQLLMLPEIGEILAGRRYRFRDQTRIARLPKFLPHLVDMATRFRTIALALTALEARYLPNIDREWLQLTNTEFDKWDDYRRSFDPAAMSSWLGYTATQARKDAELLLTRANSVDPVGSSWASLMKRAPRSAWRDLKDASLIALDYRETAEILLRFYEDLSEHGAAEPLPPAPELAWHPLVERISYRRRTLDEDLSMVGLSPHPRVILAVEGEAEEAHAPQIWRELGYPDAPELIRVLKLGGVDRDLEKVAALAVTPLVGKKAQDGLWALIKPPTRLLIAVDPEGRQFGTPDKVRKTRDKIVAEISAALKVQGVTAARDKIEHLVEIRTWSESCYEFEHFTDGELATAIREVHPTINGLTPAQLITDLSTNRARRKDIKEVWSQWDYKVSKVKLAEALWPTLKLKIDQCRIHEEAEIPALVEVVHDTYTIAQQWRYPSFVLEAADDNGS